ncbi:putative mitochondrial translation system component [Wickerhamomyces ciferrii]|uniref:Mitochondrial translation system component n=1 Tax=Wickerhamomyces ciferrii (strain ATCC 14091 / BCRC 22168 / CBS 111 / JCM 3599 / NBRC 0793 / NRRL Y-1031 F-60-10) TaxID=1206466 RepID=K0KHQ5_WICCF|nr:putative mitochondrial translation system component [Wickerhamomyces ciferrii]CCH40909.1 putative mitochondrial translation system component [Wickerhamomyces ciferrii]
MLIHIRKCPGIRSQQQRFYTQRSSLDKVGSVFEKLQSEKYNKLFNSQKEDLKVLKNSNISLKKIKKGKKEHKHLGKRGVNTKFKKSSNYNLSDLSKCIRTATGAIYPLHQSDDHISAYDHVQSPIFQKQYNTNPIYEPIPVEQKGEVPPLQHQLSRVLFQHGPQFLQDPRSKVYNFDPFLQKIIPLDEFNMNLIPGYITSSKDKIMLELSSKLHTKYYSSTSSMTGILSHLHFLISNFRPSYLDDFSKNIKYKFGTFTKSAKLPGSVIVRNMGHGKYAIDSDKSADREILLSQLGHVLEKLLTSTPDHFQKHRLDSNSTDPPTEINSYHYAKMGDFLLRSQLDCKDDRLPGNGTFDLKTRAVCAVRHDMIKNEYDSITGYEINKLNGEYESFERELFELSKSTLLKYSLQARIGNMDGIFVAYHNISRMFGFEYLPLEKIDKILNNFGSLKQDKSNFINLKNFKNDPEDEINSIGLDSKLSTKWSNDEFNISIKILNDLLDIITKDYLPLQSFRLIFKAVEKGSFQSVLNVIASPITDDEINSIQNSGYKSNKILLEDIEEPQGKSQKQQDHMNSHIEKLRELNERTMKSPIGFQVYINTELNNQNTKMRHPKYKSIEDDLKISIKIDKMNNPNEIKSMGIKFLEEKIKMLSQNTIKNDDEVDIFIKILRAFGQKGLLKRSKEEKNDLKKIWNRD